MFKKPLGGLKTSAPLRSSDRRKLKQRVLATFTNSNPDIGDLLVPEGIQSVKFSTYQDEPGVAYLDPEGNPLWLTIGKGSDDLLPTIYTLWKQWDLLPFLSTPSAVIPVLVGGADLMIPGVVHHTPGLREGQLVSIRQYSRENGEPTLSPPLVVGRMALPSDRLKESGIEKGKAVFDDMPQGTVLQAGQLEEAEEPPHGPDDSSEPTPDVSSLLHLSLLQAISTTLASLPPSSFPIPSTTFYTNHILPARPAFPASVLATGSDDSTAASIDPQDVTIKSSSHKSLTAFLKSAEKAALLTTKAPQKHSQQSELLVMAVKPTNPAVAGHRSYVTVKNIETKLAKQAEREEREKEGPQASGELVVRELWKPHQASVALIEAFGAKSTDLYSLADIKSLLNSYIAAHSLVNPNDQSYINLDDTIRACTLAKGNSKPKGNEEPGPNLISQDFMKRDELTKSILGKMQGWYEIQAPGKDIIRKKGLLQPIQVVTKVRQGRKASTLITGFEPFMSTSAEDIAEDLRKICAGSTSG
ncbi:hypothetical protein BD779DRAFT_1516510 [Infundibulicybe gibba]|nr:hypothetical protein BD779DRAFT_1516510 [Infundibulicybe gibba]